MTENMVMTDDVTFCLIGLRKNNEHLTKDFGEHICKGTLQFVDERIDFELICGQLLKQASRMFPSFLVLEKH
jgi:hypothetical protein